MTSSDGTLARQGARAEGTRLGGHRAEQSLRLGLERVQQHCEYFITTVFTTIFRWRGCRRQEPPGVQGWRHRELGRGLQLLKEDGRSSTWPFESSHKLRKLAFPGAQQRWSRRCMQHFVRQHLPWGDHACRLGVRKPAFTSAASRESILASEGGNRSRQILRRFASKQQWE